MFKYFKDLQELKFNSETKIFPGLNGVKGLLILVVVLTHCLPPSMVLYFLYFFHMPLFMGISGFLLKRTAFQNGYMDYFKKVFNRLIIPWFIATVIFLPFRMSEAPVTPLSLYDSIYPYYHLWYIPSYLLAATICFCILKWKFRVWPVLLVTVLVTIVWYVIYRYPILPANDASIFLLKYPVDIYKRSLVPVKELPLYWLGEKRVFSYIFFFITGFCLRNLFIENKLKLWHSIILIAASFVALLFLIVNRFSNIITVWPYLIFNISLVILVVVYIAPQKWMQNKLFLKVNELSLGIYLFHPLIQKLIYSLLNDREQTHHNFMGGVGIFTLVIIFTLGFILLLKKLNIADKYMLGNIKR